MHHIDRLTGITTGTRATYRRYVELDIRPHFMDTTLDMLDEDEIARWVIWMHETRGHAGKTIRNRHSLLSDALHKASRAGKMVSNPCEGTRLPRTPEVDHVYLTADEFQRFIARVQPFYQPFVVSLAGTGMRFGELTALQIRNVNFADSTINVSQAWKTTDRGAQHELGVPKTRRARRTITAPPHVMTAIAAVTAGRRPEELVFLNAAGDHIKAPTFYRNVWHPARAAFAGDQVERVKDPKTGRWKLKTLEVGPGKRPRPRPPPHQRRMVTPSRRQPPRPPTPPRTRIHPDHRRRLRTPRPRKRRPSRRSHRPQPPRPHGARGQAFARSVMT